MNINQITDVVSKLDANISKEGAEVEFIATYDEGTYEIIGTQKGLLRLGVEILRAGLSDRTYFANTEMRYLVHKYSNFNPWIIKTVKEIPPRPKMTFTKRVKEFFKGMLGFILICLVIGFCIFLFNKIFDIVLKLF